jgi:hypothetical protein
LKTPTRLVAMALLKTKITNRQHKKSKHHENQSKKIDGYFIDYIQSVALKSLFQVIMFIPFRIRLKVFGTIVS